MSATPTPVVDADTGRVALSRAHLTALVEHASGRTPIDTLPGDLRAVVRADDGGSTSTGAGSSTSGGTSSTSDTSGGLVRGGNLHPLLRPILGTLTTVRCRGVLRRWVGGGAKPAVEILIGDAGVVLLPGGPEPDVLQEVRWHPRPSAVARIVTELLDLPAEDGPTLLDARPRPWSELIALATDPTTGVRLADLRWADRPRRPPASVLVVAWHRQGGIVQVEPATTTTTTTTTTKADSSHVPDDGDGLVRCSPRHPIEVWTGLTKLAARAATATTGAGLMV